MSKRSIPRLAIATLTLGGACSDGDGGGGSSRQSLEAGGVNVTAARTEDVVDALCNQFRSCDADEFKSDYSSIEFCKDELKTMFEDIEDRACKDAALDFYGCYAKLSCDAFEDDAASDEVDECAELYAKADDLCADDLSDDEDENEDFGYEEDYDY